MIPLTRPDGTAVLINPDRIELVEETPDTVITLADGKKSSTKLHILMNWQKQGSEWKLLSRAATKL